jgi:hypothetical protein
MKGERVSRAGAVQGGEARREGGGFGRGEPGGAPGGLPPGWVGEGEGPGPGWTSDSPAGSEGRPGQAAMMAIINMVTEFLAGPSNEAPSPPYK